MPLSLAAQVASKGTPASIELALESNVSQILMPLVDLRQMAIEDSMDALRGRPMRFGKGHDVEFSARKHGVWEKTKDGRSVWRIGFKCPDALSVNLLYSSFKLPPGAKMYVYNEDRSYILGAFTSQNHKEDGAFSTGLVPGEITYVEYNAPESSPDPEIVISRVVHGYRDFFNFEKNFGSSGACNNNVNCPEGLPWFDQTNSVAMIVLAGGTRWCSGAMINNTCEDGTPYFLTANHCLTGGGVGNWMFYFGYQSPVCADIDGPTNQIVSGATLISTSAISDFALLELSSKPPAVYNAWYAGWSRANASTDTSVAIHHPSGDIKKISFSNQQTQSTLYLSSTVDTSYTHWRVPTWDDGTTEGGSSGSPLFNTEKQIVGQLHGGFASCTSITSDWYGKLSYSWNKGATEESRLREWLDPAQINTDTFNGGYFNTPAPLEAAISSIQMPDRSCYFMQVPRLSIKNKGIDTLQSLEIAWSISGIIQDTLQWSGVIAPGRITTLTLDTLSLNPGAHWLSAEILLTNGQTDFNSCNNSKTKDFRIVNGTEVALRLRTDSWPEETSIVVEDSLGNVVYTLSNFLANRLDTFYFCLELGCYNFTIFDSYGDGLVGSAFYEIIANDSLLYSGSGAFGNCTGTFMSNGCSIQNSVCLDTTSITQAPIAAFTLSDTIYNLGDTVFAFDNSVNLPTAWNWKFVSDSASYTSTAKNPIIVPAFTGWYDVELISTNGFGSDTVLHEDAFRVQKVNALNNSNSLEDIRVFPNPAKDVIHIEFDKQKLHKIVISTLSGQTIIDVENLPQNAYQLDVSGIPSGMYIIRLQSDDLEYRQKIILK